MLCVYIRARLQSGNVVCRKQFLLIVIGKAGRNCRKFQSMFEPNRFVVYQQLFFDQCLLTVGGDQYRAQKQLSGAGRFGGGGEHGQASGAANVKLT